MTDANSPDPLLKYREQHKHRLNYMPWLYWSLNVNGNLKLTPFTLKTAK